MPIRGPQSVDVGVRKHPPSRRSAPNPGGLTHRSCTRRARCTAPASAARWLSSMLADIARPYARTMSSRVSAWLAFPCSSSPGTRLPRHLGTCEHGELRCAQLSSRCARRLQQPPSRLSRGGRVPPSSHKSQHQLNHSLVQLRVVRHWQRGGRLNHRPNRDPQRPTDLRDPPSLGDFGYFGFLRGGVLRFPGGGRSSKIRQTSSHARRSRRLLPLCLC